MYTDFTTIDKTVNNAIAINNSIKNILLTRIGSVPGKPSFGSKIHDIIFEPINHITIMILTKSIRDALNKWEPRISINSIDIEEIPEYNKLIANISYTYNLLTNTISETISVSLKG